MHRMIPPCERFDALQLTVRQIGLGLKVRLKFALDECPLDLCGCERNRARTRGLYRCLPILVKQFLHVCRVDRFGKRTVYRETERFGHQFHAAHHAGV